MKRCSFCGRDHLERRISFFAPGMHPVERERQARWALTGVAIRLHWAMANGRSSTLLKRLFAVLENEHVTALAAAEALP